MAQVKCKCGQLLAVADGVAQVSCPACHATYRVRASQPPAPAAAAPAKPAASISQATPAPMRTGSAAAAPAAPRAAAKIAAALARAPGAGSAVRQAPPRVAPKPAPKPAPEPEPAAVTEEIQVDAVDDGSHEAAVLDPHDLPPVAVASTFRAPSSTTSSRAIPLSALFAARNIATPAPTPTPPETPPETIDHNAAEEWVAVDQDPAPEEESAIQEPVRAARPATGAAPRFKPAGQVVVARKSQPVKIAPPLAWKFKSMRRRATRNRRRRMLPSRTLPDPEAGDVSEAPAAPFAAKRPVTRGSTTVAARPKTGSATRPGVRPTTGKSKTLPRQVARCAAIERQGTAGPHRSWRLDDPLCDRFAGYLWSDQTG